MTPEQRLEAFRRILDKSPDDPFARYSMAMGLRGTGRPEEALREFQELSRRAPGYVPTYLMWGQTLVGLGRPEEARPVLERGMEAARQARDAHALSELTQARDSLGPVRG